MQDEIVKQERPDTAVVIPWFNIWFQPKRTIRSVVETNPERHLLLLAAISGFYRFLDQAANRSLGDSLSMSSLLILGLLIGLVAGIAALYIAGAVFRWTGSWFGGKATDLEVRAVVGWSSITDLAGLITFAPVLFLYGRRWFQSSFEITDLSSELIIVFYVAATGLTLMVWKLAIFLAGLAEVHKIPIWKSALAAILGALLLAVPAFCLFLSAL